MTPAMIATWAFGLTLAWMSGYYAAGWSRRSSSWCWD